MYFLSPWAMIKQFPYTDGNIVLIPHMDLQQNLIFLLVEKVMNEMFGEVAYPKNHNTEI